MIDLCSDLTCIDSGYGCDEIDCPYSRYVVYNQTDIEMHSMYLRGGSSSIFIFHCELHLQLLFFSRISCYMSRSEYEVHSIILSKTLTNVRAATLGFATRCFIYRRGQH